MRLTNTFGVARRARRVQHDRCVVGLTFFYFVGEKIGVVAVMVRQELVLFIMGGVFVMETLSVMLQVGSYKLRGKRIFRMAPIHHHYELKGWPEPRVIVRFWILSLVFVLIGLATLKLR